MGALWYGARSVLFVLFLGVSVVPWALAVVIVWRRLDRQHVVARQLVLDPLEGG